MDTIIGILEAMLRTAINPATAGVVIAVIGLNIHFGFTGLLNMGQAGFMLLGAYGFAISLDQGLPFPVAILVGLLAAVLFAVLLGAPTLKLRGDYLAIVTISAAEIIRYVGRLSNLSEYTGGSQGLRGARYQEPFINLSFLSEDGRWTLPPEGLYSWLPSSMWAGETGGRILGLVVLVAAVAGAIFLIKGQRNRQKELKPGSDLPFAQRLRTGLAVSGLIFVAVIAVFYILPLTLDQTKSNGWWVRLVAWSMVGISLLVAMLLVRSPWGRLLRGIREDEDAVRSLGKNVFALKMQALIIGGAFAAIGGMVYVLPSTVQPDNMGRSMTFFIYTALLLGGAATILGPLLGTLIFYPGRILIREVADAYIPDSIMSSSQTDQFSFIVVGVVLMLLVIFRPQGILGNKRELRFNV